MTGSVGPITIRVARWVAGGGLGIALILGACTTVDRATAPNEQPAANTPSAGRLGSSGGGWLGTGLSVPLLTCTPLPPAHAASVIGPEGGALTVGPHMLVVPPGALADTVTITGDVPSDTVNSIRFEPQGLQFIAGHPANLTMSYANCSLVGQLLPKRIAYTTDLLQILELLVSVDNVLLRRVSADVGHFSRYAIAW